MKNLSIFELQIEKHYAHNKNMYFVSNISRFLNVFCQQHFQIFEHLPAPSPLIIIFDLYNSIR